MKLNDCIQIRTDPETKRMLEEVSKKTGLTKSQVIRSLIEDFHNQVIVKVPLLGKISANGIIYKTGREQK